jgi:DNA-binding PadR family transcriptional regulator
MKMFHHRQEGHEEWVGGHHFFHRLPLRGILPIAVLGLIKDKPAHGGEIYQSLQEKFGIETPRPVIYMLLRRLERAGLMVSSWDIQESGPAKRRYTITEDGLEYLNLGLESLKKVSHIINQLTGEKA